MTCLPLSDGDLTSRDFLSNVTACQPTSHLIGGRPLVRFMQEIAVDVTDSTDMATG